MFKKKNPLLPRNAGEKKTNTFKNVQPRKRKTTKNNKEKGKYEKVWTNWGLGCDTQV